MCGGWRKGDSSLFFLVVGPLFCSFLTIVELVQGVFQEHESVAAQLIFPSCVFLHLEFLPQLVVQCFCLDGSPYRRKIVSIISLLSIP